MYYVEADEMLNVCRICLVVNVVLELDLDFMFSCFIERCWEPCDENRL